MGKGITGRLFKGDRVIWCVFFILCVLSLIEVFSASSRQTYNTSYWAPITKHAIFVIAGVGVAWFMHNMKAEWIKGFTKFTYILGVLMLIYALTPGGVTRNGSTRWIYIGFEFQHFEVVKLGIVMIISYILTKAQCEKGTRLSWESALSLINLRPKSEKKGDFTMLAILVAVAIPSIFIFTENLSTILILGTVTLAMMFIGCVNFKHLFMLVGGFVLIGGLGVITLLSLPENLADKGSFGSKVITWKHRLVGDKLPSDPKDVKISGKEQRIYSKIAIAEGGLVGKGPGNSVRRDYIPHAYSDFIFAIILEELGIAGGVLTIILYLTLLYRCGIIAKNCDDPYAAFLAIGIGILITIQALMHMFITVGDFITGQPLPLVSQGGTSFLVNCMYIGIVLSISRYANKVAQKESIAQKSAV
ncbi:MAG: FtsW/RodA/SpoVE family cell cycle protein [Bacteroidaceae bacterium]|nr:FtsW/RodA/SpoVE family cell cycle protein [Bacteroidaceae bacterium]